MNKLIPFLNTGRILCSRSFAMRLTADGKVIPKSKKYEERITLINPDNTVSITALKEAQSISFRRDLKLVKIQDVDSKTRRPVYKLMSNAEYHEEELKKRRERKETKQQNVKGEKLISISSRIGENDLLTNINKMMKLLQKHYEVRVIISGESHEETTKLENSFDMIKKKIGNFGQIVQKRTKGNSLRFQLLPMKDNSLDGSGSDDNNNKGPQ